VKQTSETLNLAIAPLTTAERIESLNDYFQELVSGGETGIVYLALLNEKGDYLLKTNTTPFPLPFPDTDLHQQFQQGVVHVSQPILLGGNEVGTLRYGLSYSLLKDAIDHILVENLLLTGTGLVLLTALLFAASLSMNARISHLLRASRALTEGDYSQSAPEHGHDEISCLGQHFNLMAKAVEERMFDLEKRRQEIRELNQTLENRVQQRTHELEERNDELAQVIQNLRLTQDMLVRTEKLASLGAIVATVAHELNTPIGNALTVITAFAEKTQAFQDAILQGVRRSTLEAYQNDSLVAMELTERNLRHAAELILSFKHVAVDQTTSKRRIFDLAKTLKEILTTLKPSFKNTRYTLVTDFSPGIVMDSYPGPIAQVITNFVSNSLIHAFHERADGTMQLLSRTWEGDRVQIIFADDGHGIPPEHLNRIYDPFFTTRLGTGGSGLGLHIVHNIVTGLLGGQIEVDSQLEKGTTFTVNLPRIAPVTVPTEN
jgi:signal transduction histidine kinase